MKWFSSNSVLVCGLVLVLGAANVAFGAAPPNDDCDDAKSVGDATNMAFDTTDATHDGPGHYINSPNVWYCYTATCTGCATISLAGSSFDTKLAVYDGCGCYPSAGDLIKGRQSIPDRNRRIQSFSSGTGCSEYQLRRGNHRANQ
jgi:hypothetical protein